MKLFIDKINTDTVEGYCFDQDLTDEQMKKLNLERDPEFYNEIRFIADITVEMDDHHIEIVIESLSLIGSQDGTYSTKPNGTVAYCDILDKGTAREGMLIYKTNWTKLPNYYMLDLNENKYNYDELCDEISENGPYDNWMTYKQSALIDYYHDLLKES